MAPFWDRWDRQERLEWELQALESAGYDFTILAGDPANLEQLHLEVYVDLDEQRLRLEAVFPELYPFFRLQLRSDDLELGHHQNPFEGWLCVIGRGTENWRLKDSLVRFLNRVPRVLHAGAADSADSVEGVEEQQAEPFSDYYPQSPQANRILLVDGSWEIDPDVRSGRLVLGVEDEPATLPVRALVREVQDDKGQTLAAIDERFGRAFRYTRYGRWLRLDAPIREGDPEAFFRAAAARDERVASQKLQAVDGGNFRLVATLFPEEQAWRDGRMGTGWAAAVRTSKRTDSGARRSDHHFVRVGRVGREDFVERIPELHHMQDVHIILVGLGCLGAPAALEFARMGAGQLSLIDPDFVDPPTTVRWPFGRPAFGRSKVEAMAAFLQHHHPRTEVDDSFIWKIGHIRNDPEAGREWQQMSRLTETASLIVDATGEHGVQRFLSECARHASIPYVWMEGRKGGWGGVVGRSVPGEACWACIETALAEGEIAQPPEAPDEAGRIQPQGCGSPTFTGAGFDMHTISSSGVRMSVAALGEGEDSYPEQPWNLEVIALRGEDGSAAPPTWHTHAVDRREDCLFCGE